MKIVIKIDLWLLTLVIMDLLLSFAYFFVRLRQGRRREWPDALFVFLVVKLCGVLLGGGLIAGDSIRKEMRTVLQGK
jgi:hypothetical protein